MCALCWYEEILIFFKSVTLYAFVRAIGQSVERKEMKTFSKIESRINHHLPIAIQFTMEIIHTNRMVKINYILQTTRKDIAVKTSKTLV